MFVKEVKNFDGYEADLIISDGANDILCYYDCYPPIENIDKRTRVKRLSSFLAKDIMRTSKKEYGIYKKEDFYSYQLQGEVLSIDKSIIRIGGLNIELDTPLAKDILIGEYVKFIVQRGDCSLN